MNDWLHTKRAEIAAGSTCFTYWTSLPYGDGGPTPGGSNQCADATEHHFTGKERDTESGNDYFGARYYASSMGRFLSPDYADEDDGPVSIPQLQSIQPSKPQPVQLRSQQPADQH